MDKPKDKKKVKGGKSKKKMKQSKTSSDKKTIEALKKQLRLITEKYLNDRNIFITFYTIKVDIFSSFLVFYILYFN